MNITFRSVFALGLSSLLLFSCSDNDSDTEDENPSVESGTTDISVLKSKFYHTNMNISVEDEYMIISTTNVPDHKSMYFEQNNALYEDYTEDDPDFKKNPNTISEQNYTFKIPRFPAEAAAKEASTPDGLGITVNGIVMFNQNAAPGDDIFEELYTFDQYEGHPQNTGVYHYHLEPTWITSTKGNDALVGILLDGFPLYGPMENGKEITNDDLDDYHGHFSATADFPDGIYHYHVTDEYPWINGDGYFGSAGTVTK